MMMKIYHKAQGEEQNSLSPFLCEAWHLELCQVEEGTAFKT